MSYPYGRPPHQPAYPAPVPGYPASAYAAAPGPYGYPQPAPGGGTGIAAGILALLGGVPAIITAVLSFIAASHISGGSSAGAAVVGVGYVVVGLVLFIGGILLLRRRNAGRVMVVLGCVGAALVRLVSMGIVGFVASFSSITISLVVAGVFPILTLILAALGATKRWVDAARTPAVAGSYGAAPYSH